MNSQAKRSDCIYAQISDIAAFLEIAADPLALTCDPCAYFAVANRCLEAETEHFIGLMPETLQAPHFLGLPGICTNPFREMG